jgi:adenylate kinase family enzyme
MGFSMRRVVVVGSSCSGKTVMAKSIAGILRLPHVEIDAVVWLDDWSLPSDGQLLSQMKNVIAPESWVIDGVFPEHRDMVWSAADTVVWLNYPASVVFTRALRRTLKRCITHEKLGDHNTETWRRTFFSRDSQLLWVIQSWRKRRRDYPKIMRQKKFDHIRFIQLRSPRETQVWLEKLEAAQAADGTSGSQISGKSMQPQSPLQSPPQSPSAWQKYGSNVPPLSA